jgi:hypothetical protein
MDDEAKRSLQIAEREVLNALNDIRKIRGKPPLSAFPQPPYCSFCGESKDEVGALVAGDSAFICDQCAAEAQRLIRKPIE